MVSNQPQPQGSFPLSRRLTLALGQLWLPSFLFLSSTCTPEPGSPGSSLCLPPSLPITEADRELPSPQIPKNPSETKLAPSADDKVI